MGQKESQLTISPSSLKLSAGPNTRAPSGVNCTRRHDLPTVVRDPGAVQHVHTRIWYSKQMPMCASRAVSEVKKPQGKAR